MNQFGSSSGFISNDSLPRDILAINLNSYPELSNK